MTLSSKNYEAAVQALRKKLAGKGVHGMVSLKNAFTDFDLNGDGTLSFEEFAAALEGFKLSNQEIRSLFTYCDTNQSNSVDYQEFAAGIRGELSPARIALIGKVFDLLDSDCVGVISCSDIGRLYNPVNHPDVLSERKSPAQVLQDFFETFKNVGQNGAISKPDFIDYYKNTAAFHTDEEFETEMRSVWRLNTNFKQPKVIYGSLGEMVKPRDATTVEVKRPGGITDLDNLPPAPGKPANFKRAKQFLQNHIRKQGVSGMIALHDVFTEMDLNGDGTLDFEEFAQAMETYKMSNQDIRALFVGFDVDGSQALDWHEFCEGIKGELSPARRQKISDVFDGIDADGDGVITCEDIGKCFVLKGHPDVVTEQKPEAVVLVEFLTTFKDVADDTGGINKDALMDYYSNIASFLTDEEFFHLMDSIWKIPKSRKVQPGTLGASVIEHSAEARRANAQRAVNTKPLKPTGPPSPVKSIVSSLKRSLAKRGARGIGGISRKFKILDDDGTKSLSRDEFKKGMRECDLDLTGGELDLLFDFFDQSDDGLIDFEEFLRGLRDPLNSRRLDIVNKAFEIIDTDGNGIVEIQEVVNAYNADKHPDVINGKRKANDVLKEFLETFEVGEVVDGMVSHQEFINYYTNLSASVDNDDYWELMIRNAWHISGGEGWCTNSANTRVLATMHEGSHRVLEVENDLGLDKTEQSDVILQLKRQGSADVKGTSFCGSCEDESDLKPKTLQRQLRKNQNKAKSLAEITLKSRSQIEEEKKEADIRKHMPQSLADRIEGTTIRDTLAKEVKYRVAKKQQNTTLAQKKSRRGIAPTKTLKKNVADPGLGSIIAKLKSQMKRHGANGFVGLQRKFHIMDDDGSNSLCLAEFKKAMSELNMGLGDREMRLLFCHFDTDGSGSINFDEFIQGVRDPLNNRRRKLVRQAFDVIDKDGSGIVEPKEIMDCYDAEHHPDVVAGKKTADQVLGEFLGTFDVGGVVDGMVTRDEFENYYTNIGANIDNEDYFELMIRNAWHIGGGKGAAANSANRRVLVTHADGTQSVEEINNDLGIQEDDKDEMIRHLKVQGIDVAGIDLKGGIDDVGDEEENRDEYGPIKWHIPAIDMVKGTAAPGVLPGTGAPLKSASAGTSYSARFKTPKQHEGPPVGVRELVNQLKEAMAKRGAKGLVGMARKFRSMDDDGNKSLDLTEFTKGMWEMDLNFSKQDIKRLFDYFDMDNSATIEYEELVTQLRDPLNARRRALVDLAFSKIDKDGSGVVEPEEVLAAYDGSQHPDVLSGRKSEEEVIRDFISVFEVGEVVDGRVTLKEFENYYENLGVNIDNDDYFELMIRNAWHISGGRGACENSSNLRVLCTMADGSEQVMEVKDDLGVRATDHLTIKKKLREQGHKVVHVNTNGKVEEDKKDKKEENDKSKKNAIESLGAKYKSKLKSLDPGNMPVAKGKSGKAAFGEVKGATVQDALGKTPIEAKFAKHNVPGKPSPGVSLILKQLKTQLKRRGGAGMIGLSRKFRIMDDSGDGELQFLEFKKAMQEMDFDLADKDIRNLWNHFDADESGSISYEEFIQGVREPLNKRRKNLINLAFDKIDTDGSGIIEAHEVASKYDATKHPDVIAGRKTADDVLKDFLTTFDVGGVVDGAVTLTEFTNYYHNLSASIMNDDYFELMIRNAWHISGGKGSAANSANKRVLVTHNDGSQSVVEIENDLGLKPDDSDEMVRRLRKQGVDCRSVDPKGDVEDDERARENRLNPDIDNGGDREERQRIMAKGGYYMASSQVTFGEGSPQDENEFRKSMGLSVRMRSKDVAIRDARQSNLGAGLVEKVVKHDDINYEEIKNGVVGAAKGRGSSLLVLSQQSGVEDILHNLRIELCKRGAKGISGLARKFRIIDDDNSKTLDAEEFAKAMNECAIMLEKDQLLALFNWFDKDGNGSIGYEEFLEGCRGPLNEKRKGLILLAFDVMDKDGNGILEPDDVVNAYDAKRHPEVLAGKKTENEVLTEFLDTFDVGGEKDGKVTKNEFLNYYKNISASIDRDDYFELMIRNSWHISGGQGWSANSANIRVFVSFKDGTEEVVEIKDDLGLKAGDKKEAMRRLRKQGLDPADISFFDAVEQEEKPAVAVNKNFTKTSINFG